jgi:nickel-dependent lactate racemase
MGILYEDMAKTARMAGLNYIINCIVDGFEQIIDIVFGDPLDAHRVGIERGKTFYQVPIKEEADLTVISAYPHDHGPQIFKPLIPASHATKRGGTIIMMAHCRGGLPPFFINVLEKIRTEARGDLQGFIKGWLKEKKLILPEASIDFNMAIFSLFLHTEKISILLVCPNISKGEIERMGFEYAESLQEAIFQEAKRCPKATLNIFPAGGVLVPVKQRG